MPPPVEALPSQMLTVSSPNGSSFATRNVPFTSNRAWTVFEGGCAFTTDDRYRIVVERNGETMVIERDIQPVAVQSAERRNHEEVATFNMRDVNPGWSWNGPAIPDRKAFVKSLVPAPDGRLWVHTSAPGVVDSTLINEERTEDEGPALIWTEPLTTDIFASDGRFEGRIVFPERTRSWLYSAYGDHVWGVQADEWGVEQLVRWRITPGPGDHSATASRASNGGVEPPCPITGSRPTD